MPVSIKKNSFPCNNLIPAVIQRLLPIDFRSQGRKLEMLSDNMTFHSGHPEDFWCRLCMSRPAERELNPHFPQIFSSWTKSCSCLNWMECRSRILSCPWKWFLMKICMPLPFQNRFSEWISMCRTSRKLMILPLRFVFVLSHLQSQKRIPLFSDMMRNSSLSRIFRFLRSLSQFSGLPRHLRQNLVFAAWNSVLLRKFGSVTTNQRTLLYPRQSPEEYCTVKNRFLQNLLFWDFLPPHWKHNFQIERGFLKAVFPSRLSEMQSPGRFFGLCPQKLCFCMRLRRIFHFRFLDLSA